MQSHNNNASFPSIVTKLLFLLLLFLLVAVAESKGGGFRGTIKRVFQSIPHPRMPTFPRPHWHTTMATPSPAAAWPPQQQRTTLPTNMQTVQTIGIGTTMATTAKVPMSKKVVQAVKKVLPKLKLLGKLKRFMGKKTGNSRQQTTTDYPPESLSDEQYGNENGTQWIMANGTLTCKGVPVEGVEVKLYDVADAHADLLDSAWTDADGNFEVYGGTVEENEENNTTLRTTLMDARLNFYHDCDDWMPCQRKFSLPVPAQFVNWGFQRQQQQQQQNATADDGDAAAAIFVAGTVELADKRGNEERDCLH